MVLSLACSSEPPRVVAVPPTTDSGTDASDEIDAAARPNVVEMCIVDEAYVEARKGCSVAEDCALFTYQATCCAEQQVVGIALEDRDEAQACADRFTSNCRACDPTPKRAEDGRVVSDASIAAVQCVDNRCVSWVAKRECGETTSGPRICESDEICVVYENVEGGLQSDPDSADDKGKTYRCEPNPCPGPLACSCAQALCDARNDVARTCEIKNNAEADLTCRAHRD
jgi:hypothetical protein